MNCAAKYPWESSFITAEFNWIVQFLKAYSWKNLNLHAIGFPSVGLTTTDHHIFHWPAISLCFAWLVALVFENKSRSQWRLFTCFAWLTFPCFVRKFVNNVCLNDTRLSAFSSITDGYLYIYSSMCNRNARANFCIFFPKNATLF